MKQGPRNTVLWDIDSVGRGATGQSSIRGQSDFDARWSAGWSCIPAINDGGQDDGKQRAFKQRASKQEDGKPHDAGQGGRPAVEASPRRL